MPSRGAWAAAEVPDALAGRIYKTLKVGMIKGGANLTEKFKMAKEAGFMGVEMGFPGNDVAETKKAIAESGLPVDGSVCGEHWSIRHTSPDGATRAKALENLKTALRQTHEVGGHSVLLVLGKGEDGPENEIWSRSVENIEGRAAGRGAWRADRHRERVEPVLLRSQRRQRPERGQVCEVCR